jgi:hypothetical protein
VVRAEGVEHRAIAARNGRKGGLVNRREVVVLGERVDGELPVDRAVEHVLAQWRPSADAPGLQFGGERPEEVGDVERRVAIQRYPQETRTFCGRQLGQFRWAGACFGEALLAGHADEVAVEVVGPRVIRTCEPARRSAAVRDT